MPEQLISRYASEAGGSEHALLSRIHRLDWSITSAGPMHLWPDVLKSAVRMTLMSVSSMVVLIGREGTILPNDATMEMLGSHYQHILGNNLGDMFPASAEFFRKVIDDCYKGHGSRFRDEPLKLFRNGLWQTGWFSASFTPIADEHGNVAGVWMSIAETTQRMRTFNALQRARERMQLALDAGGILGVWDLDVDTSRLTIDGAFADRFSLPSDEGWHRADLEQLAGFIHEDDRENVLTTLQQAMSTDSEFRSRFRVQTPEGEMLWLISVGRPLREGEDGSRQFAGIFIDVTEQTQVLAALHESQLRFDIMAEAVPQIVWSADSQGRRDYFNRRWTEFTGNSIQADDGMDWEKYVHPDDLQPALDIWQSSLNSGTSYDIEYRCRYNDGHYRWVREMATPGRSDDGEINRWYGIITDIDDAKQTDARRLVVAAELDHRIKNLFALTNALMSLSVRDTPEMRPLADAFLARLTALHHAHQLIHDRAGQRTNSIQDLLQHMLRPYQTETVYALIVEGDNPRISARAFTSIALIIHELLTNSVKYGALSGMAEGRLHIALHTDADGLLVRWREEFSGDRARSGASGFGSKMLTNIVEKQLRGTMHRALSEGSLSIEIRLPASALDLKS